MRLQTATRQKEALAVSTEAATKAYEKTRALLEVEETALKGFKTAMGEVEDEISEIQAELGRPQLEAGANAAVQCCVNLLQSNGMSQVATAQFMDALRVAFGTAPLRAEAAVGTSPFAVKVELGAGSAAPGTPALSSATGLFGVGGGFPSHGASAFPWEPRKKRCWRRSARTGSRAAPRRWQA